MKNKFIKIPIETLEDILSKGHGFMTLPNGEVIKVIQDDLLIKKHEIENFINEIKKELIG